MKTQNNNSIGEELANTDDMSRQWPKLDLLLYLEFPTLARNNLCDFYWKNQNTITLTEIFELVISSKEDPRPGYLISKMLDVRCIGKKAFLTVVNSMTEVDFGKKCTLIWQQKYAKFIDASRVKGNRKYCWSVPITDEEKRLLSQAK